MPNTTYGSPYAQSSDLVSNWPGVSLNIADRIDDVSFKGNGLNDQTGTTYTLVLTDAGKTVTLNNASAVTVTVPTNASVAYETGTCIYFTNKGAGVVTISAAGGVTLNNSSTLAQNGSCYIQKLDTNTWVMVSGPTPGLTLITSSTFSSVASVSVNNCFTSTYDNYRIVVSNLSGSGTITLRLRVGGVDDSSTNYVQRSTDCSDASFAAYRQNSATSLGFGGLGTNANALWLDLSDVGRAVYTRLAISILGVYSATSMGSLVGTGAHYVATAYDGITLSATSMSGTVRVYGYRNS